MPRTLFSDGSRPMSGSPSLSTVRKMARGSGRFTVGSDAGFFPTRALDCRESAGEANL
ncbi:hypothetical protein V0288_21525 [Pannus brasiliensis CCIBt3594]|uniref:Uncharacterized protein n=1 Tax=Pannus brasiliensis CCIBt3594 TaxID=1427578 RepID=A0AAW9QRQ7_9CHRO